MSDRIEDWLQENRDYLDQHELPKGHAERFANKLNSSNQGQGEFGKWIWVAAACMAVLLAISFFLGRSTAAEKEVVAEHSLSSVSREMAEVEDHLASQVAMKMEDLKAYKHTDQGVIRDNLLILKKLEKEYDLLKSDLAQNNDERIVNSMIMNYRIRLKVMDQMLASLESINNRTTKNEDLQI